MRRLQPRRLGNRGVRGTTVKRKVARFDTPMGPSSAYRCADHVDGRQAVRMSSVMDSSTYTPTAERAAGKWLSGPAGALYVDDGGVGGLPIVFAHSFAGSSAHWSAQLH